MTSLTLAELKSGIIRVVLPFPPNGRSEGWSKRRAGIEFGKEPTDLKLVQLSKSRADAISAINPLIELVNDPELAVTLIAPDKSERVISTGDLPDLVAIAAEGGRSCPHCGGGLDSVDKRAI